MEVKDYLAQNYEGYEKTLEKILERNKEMQELIRGRNEGTENILCVSSHLS